MKLKLYTAIIGLLLIINTANAQLIINEYSCANVSTIAAGGNYDDWIELYNKGTTTINLSGYGLSDSKTNLAQFKFASGTVLPGDFVLVFANGKNQPNAGGFYYASFKLTQTKPETIVLTDDTGLIIDSITTNPTQVNHSRGRNATTGNNWALYTNPTPNANNGVAVNNYAATPVFNAVAGYYASAQTITITSATAGAIIYYTLDGTQPNTNSNVYTSPIAINTTTVLRSIATNTGQPASFVQSATYFINVTHTLATVSIYSGAVDSLINNLDPNAFFSNYETSMEYFDVAGVLKASATGITNKHGNDSWAYAQRAVDFIAQDQLGYNYALNTKLFNEKNRKSFQRIILKPAANDNYPFEPGSAHIRDAYVHTLSQKGKLHLDERTWEPCVLYVNGKYWGVYEIREKVDDADFIAYYYNQPQKDVQFIKTWGTTYTAYGGNQAITDWDNLVAFINNNDMSIDANYTKVDTTLNVKSLADYFILNSYIVTTDWLNWNTAWWRGNNYAKGKKKWRYALWDMDATFGHYINYTGVPSTTPDADPCNAENLPDPGAQGHTTIMQKLLVNPTFAQYYKTRYIDLTNSIFTCTYMTFLLDSMINVIRPEMPNQIARWGGTMSEWENNVTALRTFINTRCTAVETGLKSCYALTGPYQLCLKTEPANSGNIGLNSATISQFNYTGTYYGGVNNLLRAQPSTNYVFDHWSIDNNDTLKSDTLSANVSLSMHSNSCVTAHFKYITPVDTTVIVPIVATPPVVIIGETKFGMPNVFSPNGDGKNDDFKPTIATNVEVSNQELLIYNKWGKNIAKTTDLTTGWNGKNGNNDAPDGTYYWIVKYNNSKGERTIEKGFVTLIK
jgi:gliding motility-associated-like protein